jgi:hypothetical protein
MQINSNELTGKLSISDKFDITAATSSIGVTPIFDSIDSEYILSFTNLQNVKKFTKFTYDTLGLTPTRYLKNYYRISRDGQTWSTWLDLKKNIDNFPDFSSAFPMFVEVKWVRAGSSTIGTIKLLEYLLEGELERQEVTDGSTISLSNGQTVIMKAPFIYKVFSISDIEIISGSDLSKVDIKYRYSQDNSRTWSNWEMLTKENISTTKINPIRFFQIEYSITNNSTSSVSIQDINLIGDFQNVSKDYFKTNLFGIRECCQSNMLGYTDANGNFVPNTSAGGGAVSGAGCATDGTGLPQLTSEDKAQLYNPYQQNSAMNLLTKLSNDAQDVFGHKVIYFATDPDKKGEDKVFNEYQLYNVVCQGDIKVSVEGNNFPDSQIVMNQFDLNLFETMQVHITKQQFKEIFGPQRRPSKEDFLYFCDINRLFTVDHAQQFRNFNNAAVYYKLILKKFNKQANVNYSQNNEVKQSVDMLTKNSTIDELFGADIKDAKNSIANKDQFKPLTKDPIRLSYNAEIDKELIENSSTIISRSNYDLASVNFGDVAVQYLNMEPYLKVSDNLSYYFWFNINNYVIGDNFNFFTNYDSSTSQGFKIDLKDDKIDVVLNTATYSFDLMGYQTNDVIALEEEVWYCYVVNIDQRQRKLEQWIYKRDCDDESRAGSLISTILRKEYYNVQDITPIEYLIDYTTSDSCKLVGSDMKATNIRLFNDVIPESYHNKILNQYIIGDDSKHLIFADNANSRIFLPKFPSYE